MKNYLIATLIAIIIFMGTFIFRIQNTMVLKQFPVPAIEKVNDSTEPTLFLFLFFSKKGCKDCSDKVVRLLNGLTDMFLITGVIPEDELENQQEIRNEKGITFQLHGFGRYRNYLPPKIPTLICVNSSGEVIFIRPVFKEQTKELESLLAKVYGNRYSFAND